MPEPGTVLAMLPCGESAELSQIFRGSPWELLVAPNVPDACATLRDCRPAVVIAAGNAGCPAWKDLLATAREMSPPPQLIVAERCPDEILWAEVLNLGGYDVLALPFEQQEVLHVVGMAWRCWEQQKGRN